MICFSEFIIYKSTTDNLVYVPENRLFAYFTDRNVCDTFLRKLICVWYIKITISDQSHVGQVVFRKPKSKICPAKKGGQAILNGDVFYRNEESLYHVIIEIFQSLKSNSFNMT